jgi:hypothetical protein
MRWQNSTGKKALKQDCIWIYGNGVFIHVIYAQCLHRPYFEERSSTYVLHVRKGKNWKRYDDCLGISTLGSDEECYLGVGIGKNLV